MRVAGVVTHRQRPHTASGMIFLNLEDETGLLNVSCRAGMWRRYRNIGRRAVALIVRGTVDALKKLEEPQAVAARRGKALDEIAPHAMLRTMENDRAQKSAKAGA